MIKDGQSVDPNITSFLLECLLWNVPDWIFNEYDTWTERLKYSIVYLWDKTMIEDDCKTWTEVSEMLYLFHGARKWSRPEVNLYLANLWVYLEYS